MKKFRLFAIFAVALVLCLCAPFAACAGGETGGGDTSGASEEEDEQRTDSVLPEEGGSADKNTGDEIMDEIFLTVNGRKICVKTEDNQATRALKEILKQGDITYTASDYGGFEKVGALGFSLPAEDKQMTTEAGDVILYSGDRIVLFYGSNSWSYTRIGRVSGISTDEWKGILTSANPLVIKISL